MKSARSVLLLVILSAIAALAGALLARSLTHPVVPLASGTWLPTARPVASFALTDLAGKPFDLAELTGHATLVFFGFTYCPDICPTTLAQLAEAVRDTPLPGLQVVFVTIDPERDSADNLRQYLRSFSEQFIGLRGPMPALQPLMKSLGAIAVRQNLPDGNYTMDHSATVYLLDTKARLAAVFTPPVAAATLSADLRAIAASGRL
jgi:protein SCO1/2